MAFYDAGERLTHGLTIRDGLKVVGECLKRRPDFADLDSQEQQLIFMAVYLDQAPMLSGRPLDPRAFDWDKFWGFVEILLPILLKIFGL